MHRNEWLGILTIIIIIIIVVINYCSCLQNTSTESDCSVALLV